MQDFDLTKGDFGGACNITACQKPNSAFWYNQEMDKYYCRECAARINLGNRDYGEALKRWGDNTAKSQYIFLCIAARVGFVYAPAPAKLNSDNQPRTVTRMEIASFGNSAIIYFTTPNQEYMGEYFQSANVFHRWCQENIASVKIVNS